MPTTSALQRSYSFLATFARRQAARTVELPGGFAVYDDEFAHSRADNQVFVGADVDPEALPAVADEALRHLPYRMITVLDDAAATACAEPLVRAAYTHSRYLVLLHTGPVPSGGPADVVRFIGARTPEGEVASWADLYLDPAAGLAQIEDLVTSQAHLRRGYGDAVLATALRRAADADCGTRFLIADAADWPREWYGHRGFTDIGCLHCFDRAR